MPCYRPIPARILPLSSGKKKLIFSRRSNFSVARWLELEECRIPCGKCIGCQLDKSREWAFRCEHEASMHRDNCFVTLTFDDQYLPFDGSVHKRDLQLFFKRFRKHFGAKSVRYFACGEYGGKSLRPHYHAILFGFDFDDKELYTIRNGESLYISPTLQKLWPFGFSTVGSVTFESCAYVARYTAKKAAAERMEDDDRYICDALELDFAPEFLLMSRKPGIGKNFIKKYLTDVYNYDIVVTKNGSKARPPRFYDDYYEKVFDDLPHNASYVKLKPLEELKQHRREMAALYDADNTEKRLADRELAHELKAKKLKRSLYD